MCTNVRKVLSKHVPVAKLSGTLSFLFRTICIHSIFCTLKYINITARSLSSRNRPIFFIFFCACSHWSVFILVCILSLYLYFLVLVLAQWLSRAVRWLWKRSIKVIRETIGGQQWRRQVEVMEGFPSKDLHSERTRVLRPTIAVESLLVNSSFSEDLQANALMLFCY